eukprot:6209096-Pleurochrysis_carterae.AAC.3
MHAHHRIAPIRSGLNRFTAPLFLFNCIDCTCPSSDRNYDTHFSTTPQDLISDGLFDDLAIEFVPMPHREVSLALAARTISTDLPAKQKRFWGIDSAKSWFSWTRKKREVQSTSREENLAPISDATNQGASALDGGNPERKSETI